jgi:hypothetical protein
LCAFRRPTCASAEPSIAGTSPKPLSAASELDFVGLVEALELTLLLVDGDIEKYNRAALRWHVRFVEETKNVDIRESQAVLGLLAAIPAKRAGRYGAGRAPQPPALLRADHRRTCPLVAGGVELRGDPSGNERSRYAASLETQGHR